MKGFSPQVVLTARNWTSVRAEIHRELMKAQLQAFSPGSFNTHCCWKAHGPAHRFLAGFYCCTFTLSITFCDAKNILRVLSISRWCCSFQASLLDIRFEDSPAGYLDLPLRWLQFSSVTDLLEQETIKSKTQNCYLWMCTNCNYTEKSNGATSLRTNQIYEHLF